MSTRVRKELHELFKRPCPDFQVSLPSESNLNLWHVTVRGPPGGPYHRDFTVSVALPPDYPMSPPAVKFLTRIWHPNVYSSGEVCMSILHPSGDDPLGYESADERWSPILSVEKVIVSLIAILGEPNPDSPANVDAACALREMDSATYAEVASVYMDSA